MYVDLSAVGQAIRVECPDEAVHRLVAGNFDGLRVPAARAPMAVYALARSASGFAVAADGLAESCADEAELLFAVEKGITLLLQRRRSDLLFLHAAAVETGGRALLVLAQSGGGKSTVAWTLLHHGFQYLSDELAPVDLARLEVHPYAHAVCLKWSPPPPFSVPADSLRTRWSWHVPTAALPTAAIARPRPIGSLLFLEARSASGTPRLEAISPGQAAARLYQGALNALAHPIDGLDAVVHLARSAPAFTLSAADPESTAALLVSAFGG
jgi:hypothetical protein